MVGRKFKAKYNGDTLAKNGYGKKNYTLEKYIERYRKEILAIAVRWDKKVFKAQYLKPIPPSVVKLLAIINASLLLNYSRAAEDTS